MTFLYKLTIFSLFFASVLAFDRSWGHRQNEDYLVDSEEVFAKANGENGRVSVEIVFPRHVSKYMNILKKY